MKRVIKIKTEDIFKNRFGMKFKLIPAGTFMMGQKDIAEPVHKVRITKPFYFGIYPVTQREWKSVMGNNPSRFRGDNFPVTRLSWNDCQDFIKNLNEIEQKSKADHPKYRLPTEAEWEYSCRAGSTSMFCFKEGKDELEEYAWFYNNSEVTQEVEVEKGIFTKRWELTTKTGRMVHPVGQLRPNKFGLYDMHGNIYEWCEDWFGDYLSGEVVDVIGIRKIGSKVMRGGSVLNFGGYCASAHRDARTPSYRSDYVGVRIVRPI